MKILKMIFWQLGVAGYCSVGLLAAELYISPTGTSDGTGRKDQPLDIATALSDKSPAQPGDTLLFLGDVYTGPHETTLIVTPWKLSVSGTAEKPIKIRPAPGALVLLNGLIALTGSYVQLIDLNIGDPDWNMNVLPKDHHDGRTAILNGLGGTGAKIINCNLFGGSMPIGAWEPCHDLEIYGCLLHDFGYTNNAGKYVHAIYTQNSAGTKTIEHNLAYRGSGWNLHAYGREGHLSGYDIIENIFYIAGAVVPKRTVDNFLVASKKPADRIRLIGNVAYQPVDAEMWRPNARMTSYSPATNGTGVCKDNYFAGASYGLSIGNWQQMEITSNTIWATGILLEISSVTTGSGVATKARPDLAGYTVDNNTYYDNGKAKSFKYGPPSSANTDELQDWAGWQKLGLDKHSQMLPGKDGKPTGTKAFVFANKYENGRAQVGIFNWDGKDQVEVDLSSALKVGQKFAVYNCLDITQTIAQAKPVLTATYDGHPVPLPMRKYKISPDFDAFLVLLR